MRLLIDECVPKDVSEFLSAQKHEVLYVVEELAPKSPDPVVVQFADHHRLICVTWNRRHFRSLISRRPHNNNLRFRYAGMIAFECSEPRGRERITRCHNLIVFAHDQRQHEQDKRLIVDVTEEWLKIW